MFTKDQSGSVALLFALMLPALMVGVGGGIEVSRAVDYKQRLTSAADLACRQAEVYVESLPGPVMPLDYSMKVRDYGTMNLVERALTDTAQIAATPTVSKTALGMPLLNLRPGNIHVVATGTVDLVFKNFLSKNSLTFTVTRDCTVTANASSGPPTLLMSESFEDYAVKNGWALYGTLGKANCVGSACPGKFGTTNAGVEIDQLSAIETGDGVQYGQQFAELDSDCTADQRIGAVTDPQKTACSANGQTTNSSINMPFNDLKVGVYEVRYVYNARKNIPGVYEYNDSVICSSVPGTDGLTRNSDVAKNAAGVSTTSLDYQTRRIELWVEPESSGYLSDSQSLTATSNASYMQKYMVDVCVWSKVWTERSYRFTVTKQQNYRVSWRAAGRDDSYGGLIDYIRICRNACP
ncbi:TadE/TadG family type IV pilus assembly protein [Methylobacterium thuringiense]|uniref:Putative Flp pilus-assembly TadG-like N-terminal domain-containing protein n=1 Tax=Methylobacterium thuringiense TaxID=1003091 RepID=A0ABQ4TJH7_9HYPH|nr:TadE/TadG family type IV pilus assembly protein [Methylobacterium thuringiense]GJE54969.1 hypothetical protein EKPJFOCH_1455 [Methylobacterium thuringiense]